MLKLRKFQVVGFRSVHDSGWIETDTVTALVGVNESGKTNLLLPLWKFSPAKDGEIVHLADYPRSEYTDRRQRDPEVFVRAVFETDGPFRKELAKLTQLPEDNFKLVQFERLYDGKYYVKFPSVDLPSSAPSAELKSLLLEGRCDIEADSSNDILKASLLAAIDQASGLLEQAGEKINQSQINAIHAKLREAPIDEDAETSQTQRWIALVNDVENVGECLGLVHPNHIQEARQKALRHKPSFVYYSNYGNLDSEIYLPHVIDNLERQDLGAKESAKARTLRVLFSFVGLKPEEILELGRSLSPQAKTPTEAEIAAAAQKTKERSVLLQAASTKLTKEFRAWWKQGEYRFRFEADGDHFRIWVADDQRPEEVELEARSTGLQWFLSFFLVFLVESEEAHESAVLLLDEPGLSLHPLAQKDLTQFFDSLAKTNQLLYTTHSPFLVDPDRLDQVRAVYVNSSGTTVVSSDLRAGKASSPEFKSVYAVHSALGLSISDALLSGCTNVVVEGASDQLYLSTIKTVLIALGKIQPQRELLFLPGGGAKGVTALVPIFTGKDEAPPHVILDSDEQGLQFAKKLRDGAIYAGTNACRIQCVGEILDTLQNAEVEDLLPFDVIVDTASRLYRGEDDFQNIAEEGKSIVPQIEQYAEAQSLRLGPGWKVDLARAVKQRLVKAPEKCPPQLVETWTKLFEPFVAPKIPSPQSPKVGRDRKR